MTGTLIAPLPRASAIPAKPLWCTPQMNQSSREPTVSEKKAKTEILIVEDRDSLRHVLPTALEMEDDFHTCGSARSGEEALELIANCKPDLALIDLALPGMDGIELVTAIRKDHPETCCVILSGHKERNYAQLALEAGALGYIVKGRPGEMITGIRSALAGQTYLSTSVAGPAPETVGGAEDSTGD